MGLHLSGLDLILAGLLGVCLVRGAVRGMVAEIALFASWALAFLLVKRYGGWFLQLLPSGASPLSQGLALVIAFAFFLVTIRLLALLLRHLLRGMGLGLVDRLGGAVVGLLKGALFCCTLLLVLILTLPSSSSLLRSSRLGPWLEPGVEILGRLLPSPLREELRRRDPWRRSKPKVMVEWRDGVVVGAVEV